MMLPTITHETLWIIIGFLGQSMFSARFFLQWLASEKAGDSVVPRSFWYFSICGGVTLFIYALYRQDPVFVLGQGSGLFIYMRNLHLIRRKDESAMLAQN